MDFTGAFGRLLRRYAIVVLLAITLPAVAVGLYRHHQPATYTAHARIVAATATPQAAAEASAVVSQVQALATGRDVVAAALGTAKVSRDPDEVIRVVAVTGLGTSALVDIAYTDRDPETARKVTAALTDGVVKQLDAARLAGIPEALQNVAKQLAALNNRRARVAAAAQSSRPDLVAQNELTDIDQQISDLTSERSRLGDDAAAVGHTSVVATPVRPTRADPDMAAIAGLLGLVVGLIIVGVDQTVRPRVSGVLPVARLLNAPALGTVGANPARLMDVGRCIRLAAWRAGVSTVVLTRPGHRPLAPELVDRIAAATLRPQPVPPRVAVPLEVEAAALVGVGPAGSDGLAAGGAGREVAGVGVSAMLAPSVPARVGDAARMAGPVSVLPADEASPRTALREVYALEELDPNVEFTRIGVVILASGGHRLRAVDAVRDLVAASGWPVLGVLGEGRRGGRAR
jgi:hypothetical protein